MKVKNTKRYIVMFVCSGNSCRSPIAEGLLQKKLYPKYNDKVKIHSSGTLGLEDNPATLHAITVARENGIDISKHLSKGIKKSEIAEADIIFALADHHLEFFEHNFVEYKENVFLLKSFATGSDKPKNVSINDPIGQSLKVYRQTINQIDKELNRILPQLEMLINNKLNES